VKNGTYIYMTFDDGPNEGTPYVLDALKEVGVSATFFINSDNLVDGDQADKDIVEFSKI
jgi:peptidoglycan/xylan/chitin deacetylase (PgdA/CDA1 family)